MATRTISTRLAVQGESQYRAAITSVNAELKNMQSALQMTESQYKNNANSIEALTAKDQALNNLLAVQKQKVVDVEAGLKNAQQAEAQYAAKKDALTEKIEENCRALEELKSQSGDTTDEQKRLTEENERLNAELAKNEDYLKSAKRAVNNWQTDLNKAKTAVNETENAIKENNAALDEHQSKTKANADAINALAAAMVASGLKAAIKEIAEALTECVDASVEFESAMAGVKKTTNMSDAELGRMSEEIKQLATEIPITTTELAGIVEVAGQLGIQKDNLLSFSKVMANLGVSTNMTSEEAATMLARFANVTKMSPELYENLGSVIVALGNNFATTESEIVEMGQRLAAAGKLAGLTEPEIMAIAAAMSSVGIQAEAGGTAMTQTLTEMESAVASGGDKLGKFAEISGMSAEQFAAAWKNEPIVAIRAFIEGLGKLDEQGESATLVLEEMGLKGVRQGNMLKSLATASGLLANTVSLANTAWAENTALMTEANTRYQTTESKITMFKNSVNNLKIAVGDQLTPAIGDLASKGTDVVEWATDFANENEWLALTISAVAASMSVLLGFITTATVVIPVLTKLIAALNSSFLATPAGMVAAGIAAVTAAVVVLVETLPSASEEADALRESMNKCAESFEDADKAYESTAKNIDATAKVAETYIKRLEELEKQGNLTAEEQAEYNRLVGEVSSLLPDANTTIDETTGLLQDGAAALRANVDEWYNMAQAAAESARIEALTKGLTDAYVALYQAQDELTVLTSSASEQTLEYASALQDLYAAQANLREVQRDASSDYYDIEAAQAAVDGAQNALIESSSGLTREEKEAGKAIASLRDEFNNAQEGVAAYEEKIRAVQTSLADAGTAAQETKEGVEGITEAFSTAGEESGAAVVENFGASIQPMPEVARSTMSDTEQVIVSSGESIRAKTENIGTQAVQGFDTELKKAVNATKTTLSNVMNTVSGYSGQARSSGYSVGAAISQGAAAGVRDYAAQVAAEAAQMVTNAINAANRAAQINSPSRLTRKTGRGLDEGIIVGINELKDDVISTMEDTMRKVASVQVDVPDIPDHTTAILDAITGGMSSENKVLGAVRELSKRKKELPPISVVQNIYAEDTSYAGQQRESKRRMREIVREISR